MLGAIIRAILKAATNVGQLMKQNEDPVVVHARINKLNKTFRLAMQNEKDSETQQTKKGKDQVSEQSPVRLRRRNASNMSRKRKRSKI